MRKSELQTQVQYWQNQAGYWQGCYMTAQTTLNALAMKVDTTPELMESISKLMYPPPVIVDSPSDVYAASEPVIPKLTQMETWDWTDVLASGMVPDGFVEAAKREDEE